MAGPENDPKGEAPPPSREDTPKNAGEPDDLNAKVARLNKVTEQLGEAMREKPKKT